MRRRFPLRPRLQFPPNPPYILLITRNLLIPRRNLLIAHTPPILALSRFLDHPISHRWNPRRTELLLHPLTWSQWATRRVQASPKARNTHRIHIPTLPQRRILWPQYSFHHIYLRRPLRDTYSSPRRLEVTLIPGPRAAVTNQSTDHQLSSMPLHLIQRTTFTLLL